MLSMIALLALGTALRWAWVQDVAPSPKHDAAWYVSRAKVFARGQGVTVSHRPTAYRPVAYPVLLGSVYFAFGELDSAHRYLNLGLAAITLACLCIATLLLTGSRAAAACATAIFACYPTDVAYTSLAVSEPLFNACMLGAVVAAHARRRWLGIAISAALIVAASMTRASGVVLLVLLGLMAPLSDPSRRSRLKHVALLVVLSAALLAPFWVRNARAFGGFVPIANNGGVNLFIGNNPLANGAYRFDRAVRALIPPEAPHGWLGSGGQKEYQVDRELNRLAVDHILSHPRETLALVPAKLRYLLAKDHTAFEWIRSRDFRPSAIYERAHSLHRHYYQGLWLLASAGLGVFALRGRERWLQAGSIALAAAGAILAGGSAWFVGIACALIGLGLLRPSREPRVPWFCYAAIGSFIAFQLVYFGDPRFHHALMPWVAMSAGSWFALTFGGKPMHAPERA